MTICSIILRLSYELIVISTNGVLQYRWLFSRVDWSSTTPFVIQSIHPYQKDAVKTPREIRVYSIHTFIPSQPSYTNVTPLHLSTAHSRSTNMAWKIPMFNRYLQVRPIFQPAMLGALKVFPPYHFTSKSSPRPKFVLSFGALDDLLFRAAAKRGGVSRFRFVSNVFGFFSPRTWWKWSNLTNSCHDLPCFC